MVIGAKMAALANDASSGRAGEVTLMYSESKLTPEGAARGTSNTLSENGRISCSLM